jgi:LacI family transcriptional regulator
MHEPINCPYCGRDDGQLKAGMNGDRQRFRCAHCAKRYTADPSKRGYPPQVREKARSMHAEGASASVIAQTCGVAKRTVFLWLKEAAQQTSAPAGERDKTVDATSQPVALRRASIKDVAAHAGVSVSTISNFLNRTGRMSEATERRVRAAIDELHFAPNSLTRAIRERRTRILGLITYGISDLEQPNSITSGLLAGVNTACQEADYDFLVYTNFWQPEKHYTGINFLNGQVDGLIWVSPDMREPLLQRVGEAGLPTVALLSRHVPKNVGYVNADNAGGIRLLVEHLAGLGHRRLAFLGPEFSSNYQDRRDGFWKAVNDAGLTEDCCEFYPRKEMWVMQRYDHAIQKWFTSPNPPTAVVTADDGFAHRAISCLNALGYRVPDDVSVTGFCNAPSAAWDWPGALTTIHQPIREIALAAGRQLIDRIEGRTSQQIIAETLDVQLVVRGSTGPVP